MRIHRAADHIERLVAESESDNDILTGMLRSNFKSEDVFFVYQWSDTASAEGVYGGVLLDSRDLDDAGTLPSHPITVIVRPDGSVRLTSPEPPGLTISSGGRVTVDE